MSSEERRDELYLRMVVEILHGVTLEQFDRDGRQRAVDYVFTSPSGDGAVEMTTYRDGQAAAWFDKLSDGETIECVSPRGWAVMVRLGTKLDELRRRLPAVVAACDRHQVDNPARVPATEWDADLQWFVETAMRIHPTLTARPGTIRVEMPPTMGFPRSEGLEHDLERLLSDQGIATKLRKLREHEDVKERHLAIGVLDFYKPGLDLAKNLLFDRGHVPQYVPTDDFAATHVWITAGGYAVLTWTRPGGWVWLSLPRPE